MEDKLHLAEEQQSLGQLNSSGSALNSTLNISGKRSAECQNVEAWLDDQTKDEMAPDQDMLMKLSNYGMQLLYTI